MKDEDKTKEQLINELSKMRLQLAELEKSEIEFKLADQFHFYQMLFDLLPIPIFRKDKYGIYTACNKAYEDFLNINQDKFIGKSVHDISPKELADIYHAKDLELFQNPGVQAYESKVLDKTGMIHNVIFHKATYTDQDGQTAGLIGVIFDITDRKRAEEEQRHREKLQGVLEMAGAICHEMNQPMQIVSGYSELLLTSISENDPIYAKLDTINKQVYRMAAITRKLMKIKDYETQDYAGFSRIIDINKSSDKDT